MKLLLVEDEEELSNIVAKVLRQRGYAVDASYDGADALYQYEVNQYDLIILDLNLPEINGLEVLKQIREKDTLVKILILSARSEIEQRVEGLDLGANDYLVKPFDLMELEARIRTLLRISFLQQPAQPCCGSLSLNISRRTFFLNEQELPLTKKEYGVLEYLIMHMGIVISAEELIEHVWDSETDPFSNSLKYHIHSIKKKIGTAGGQPEWIKNIRRQGYILEAETKKETV